MGRGEGEWYHNLISLTYDEVGKNMSVAHYSWATEHFQNWGWSFKPSKLEEYWRFLDSVKT